MYKRNRSTENSIILGSRVLRGGSASCQSSAVHAARRAIKCTGVTDYSVQRTNMSDNGEAVMVLWCCATLSKIGNELNVSGALGKYFSEQRIVGFVGSYFRRGHNGLK